MDERFVKYSYDGSFDGNILIVGRTGCGKITFIQKIAQNKMFGKDIMFFGFQKFILVLKEKKVLENVLLNKMSSLLILVT